MFRIEVLHDTDADILQKQIRNAAWIPLIVDGGRGDAFQSSLDSKMVKFLQFPPPFTRLLETAKTVVVMDHKRVVQDIPTLLRFHATPILIREHEKTGLFIRPGVGW